MYLECIHHCPPPHISACSAQLVSHAHQERVDVEAGLLFFTEHADPVDVHPMQVATLDSVVIYDTASPTPLCLLGALHYDSITDLAWSGDARYLAVSSRDCYCSIAVFEPGELGEALAGGEAERWLGGVGKPAPGPQPADAAVALPDSAVQLDQLDGVLPPGPAPAQGPEQEHARPAACPTPVLKKARRIVPEAVPCQPQPAPTVAAADQSSADDSFTFPAPPSAPPSEPPTACDPLQAARCPAQPAKRRLVPTPVQPLTGSAQARFSAACQVRLSWFWPPLVEDIALQCPVLSPQAMCVL